MSKNLSLRAEVDQIQDYLVNGEGTLSEALREKLTKLARVADWLSEEDSHGPVARKIIRMWPDECSLPTAYRMIGEAQEIYTPRLAYNRAFYVDKLLGDVSRTHRMALAAGDLKTMAACERNKIAIIEKFMGTNEEFPIEKVQPPRLVFSNDPQLAGAPLPANWQAQLAAITRKRKVGVVANHPDFEEVASEPVLDATQNEATATGS